MTLEGQKGFIHTHEMIFVIDVGFRHPNFSIKGNIVYSTLLLSFHYCYVEIYTKSFVKMRGSINKEMVEKMKMKDKKEKMVVTFSSKGRSFFQRWTSSNNGNPRKDVEWAKHVGIFSLFSKQMRPIRSLVKEFM
jgi:hypothetical protein